MGLSIVRRTPAKPILGIFADLHHAVHDHDVVPLVYLLESILRRLPVLAEVLADEAPNLLLRVIPLGAAW
jgi:hypothetical protein